MLWKTDSNNLGANVIVYYGFKRFVFFTAVYDFLYDSRTTNVFSLNDRLGRIFTEKDKPLEKRTKGPTLFFKETDGNLLSRQSDMKLFHGHIANSIVWKSGSRIIWWSIFFWLSCDLYHNLFDVQYVVEIKDMFNASNILLPLIVKETTYVCWW